MKKILAKCVFKMIGWKVIGSLNYPAKCVIIAAPHTSNWDFFFGKCYSYITGIKAKYLIKSELFFPILGSLLKWDGGIAINRKSANNIVKYLVKMFSEETHLHLGIAPEGTRKKVKKWKTGFYHIAVHAKVPILLLKLDYKTKEVGVFNQLEPSGNIEYDMKFIQDNFIDVCGKKPKNYNPKIF